MAKALHVSLPAVEYMDTYEGENLTFEYDGDGDLLICDGKERIAVYHRGHWKSATPPTVKRTRRS